MTGVNRHEPVGAVSNTPVSSELRFAILDVLHTYCELIDDRQYREMAHLVFTEDARESHGLGMPTLHGRREIEEFFARVLAPFEGMMHTISNTRVRVVGEDEVHATSRFIAFHWLTSTALIPDRPADLISTGIYLDEFVLTPDGWRVASRKRRNVGPSPVAVGGLPTSLDGLGGASTTTV